MLREYGKQPGFFVLRYGPRTFVLFFEPIHAHDTKERRLFAVPLIAFLGQTMPVRLYGDFAPLVDHTCQALGADFFLVLVAIGTRPAYPPVWTALALEKPSIFTAFSSHILSLLLGGSVVETLPGCR